MISTKYKLIMILGSAALVLAFAACTEKSMHDPDKHHQRVEKKITAKLDLNEQQQAKMRIFSQKLSTAHRNMRQKSEPLHGDLMMMLEQPQIKRQQTIKILGQYNKLIQENTPALVNSFADFYDTLTQEQRKIFRSEVESHIESHHHRHN